MSKPHKKTHILLAPLLSLLIALFLSSNAFASADSPAGKWRTFDDETGSAKSIVEITVTDNVLRGSIIKLIDHDEKNPLCDKCTGERENQPVIGMMIIWNVIQKSDYWGKGKILDPNNGKTYKVKFTLLDEGQKLKVRGYIGAPAFGRTQYWERVKQD